MAYVVTEDSRGRQVKIPVFNESEDGSGTWHVPVCDASGFLKVALQSMADDTAFTIGAASLLWETADANANYLLEALPVGGATDVPVHVIGDANAINVDTGFFDGITMPTLAILNIARDAYISFDAGDDGVAAAKGIYFKAAADEDIELINLSVTGTPRVFWDESESQVSSNVGWIFGGDVSLGGNKLTTTNLSLYQLDANTFAIADNPVTAAKQLQASAFLATSAFWGNAAAVQILAQEADDAYIYGTARDAGVGNTEIWRMQGAADPYFQILRDDTGVATNGITDGVVFGMGAGTNNEAAGQGFGMVFKLGNAASQLEERASIDVVLVTATDGSEDARFDWNLMSAGAMNLAMQLAATGVLDVDASSGLGAATVGLFDDYDDALILRQGISERKMEVLERIGVMRKKESGSGWFMNVQAMSYLLAGGIYQTRQALEDVKDELMSRLESIEKELVLRRN